MGIFGHPDEWGWLRIRHVYFFQPLMAFTPQTILGVTICLLYCLTRAVYGKAFLKVLNILPYLEFLKRYGTMTDLIVKFQIF